MIDVDAAQRIVLTNVPAGPTVELPLMEALYRTLASPICCDLDCPPFDRSVMDGYAVRAGDVSAAPVVLRIVGQVAAGTTAEKLLGPGETVQINTGAPIPEGADAVVCVEDTEPAGSDQKVLIQSKVDPGNFITSRATYVRAGKEVLPAGAVLTPINVGVAATAGASRVTVFRRPTVAILSTGEELVDIHQTPTGAQIRNSNQYLLEGLVLAAHAEPFLLGVAPDDRDAIRHKIEEGLRCDILCTIGGASVGPFDFVPHVLEELGCTFHIRKMATKPGRPTHFASAPNGTLIFALPGNPMSALVGFELLVRPALRAVQGRPDAFSSPIRASLRGSIAATDERRSYRPARAKVTEDGRWEVEPLSWHGSGDLTGAAEANALIMRPPCAPGVNSGDAVSVYLLEKV